jgi:tRNA A-37 threonylcarbamoyl transferase component Bud32
MKGECPRKKQMNGWTLQALPELLEATIFESCCTAIETPNRLFERIRSSATTAVFRFTWQGKEYYLKHYLFEGWRKHLKLRAKISRLPQIAAQLSEAGFSTPAVVCFAFKGRMMFSVSEAAASDCSIGELYIKKGAGRVSDMARFRERFGQEIGRLHAAGFVHGDLRWENVLVKNPDGGRLEFIYLDNDRTRKHPRLPAWGRVKNLVQIHFVEILQKHPPSDWEEFWAGYRSADPVVQQREPYWKSRVERKSLQRAKKWLGKKKRAQRIRH